MTRSKCFRHCNALWFSSTAHSIVYSSRFHRVQSFLRWRTQADATANTHRDCPTVWTYGASRGREQQLLRGDRKFRNALSEQSGYAIWIGHTVFREHSLFDWQLLYAHHRASTIPL